MTRFDEQTQEYKAMLDEIFELFVKKGKDYGTKDDHYQNLRAGEAWGIDAYIGAYIRLCDKLKRVQKHWLEGKLENETLEDSMRDIIVYAGNAYQLWKEKQTFMVHSEITGETWESPPQSSMINEFIKADNQKV